MSGTQDKARFGLIVVGDEILSGRRQDKHFPKVVELLGARGLQLSWVEILSDDRAALTEALTRSFAGNDIVFCCGGIGATPDDHTRQAAAAALGRPLVLHPFALEQITIRCEENAAKGQGTADMTAPENVQRLQMGFFPEGCEAVVNPFNRIPGFHIQNHTFVPGFPVMAWPMLEAIIDSRYAHLHNKEDRTEHSFIVYSMPESRITPALEALEQKWPGVRAFSLPSVGDGGGVPHIELGVKGESVVAAQALEFLRAEALRLGGRYDPPAK
ncbi:MAG: molybdopterin-binding protein [Burkholderiaceae bacterium]|nr:molybdopterin-binding protein [Burkholderiaceae bacterium]